MATLQDILATVVGGLAGTSPALARGIGSASDVFNAIQRKKLMEERGAQQEQETARRRAIDVTRQAEERQAGEAEAARVGGIREDFLRQVSSLPEGQQRTTLETAIRGAKDPGRFTGTLMDLFKPQKAAAPEAKRSGTVFDPSTNTFVHSEDIQPGQTIRPGPRPPTPKEEESAIKQKERQLGSQGKLIKMQRQQTKLIEALQTPDLSPQQRAAATAEAKLLGEQMALEREKLGLAPRLQAEQQAEDQQKAQGNVIRYDAEGNRVQ